MPNRILRDGILTSEAVNRLGWAEEVFYRRLMSVVDDFGRFYAAPKLLRAACYPLHIDKVSDSDIGKWLSACETAALVRVYPAPDGKRYLELMNFRQQVRAKDSKFPSCDAQMHSTCTADAQQVLADAHLDVSVFGDVDEGDKAPRKRDVPPDGVSDSVWQDFKALRRAKKAAITDTAIDGIRREAEKAGMTLDAAMREMCTRGWQGFKADWMTPARADPGPARASESVEATQRMLDERQANTKPPPAHIRDLIASVTKRVTA